MPARAVALLFRRAVHYLVRRQRGCLTAFWRQDGEALDSRIGKRRAVVLNPHRTILHDLPPAHEISARDVPVEQRDDSVPPVDV